MIRIALRETKINIFYVIFASLGLSVLFALIFVLANFRFQATESYFDKFGVDYLMLETNKTELLDYQIDDLFLYARASGLTYDTTISYEGKDIKLPSYSGGICILSMEANTTISIGMSKGYEFSLNDSLIWLSEELASLLECDIRSSISLNNRVYKVEGIFDQKGTAYYFGSNVSFLIYSRGLKDVESYTLTAVVWEPEEIMKLAKIDQGKIFDDKDGILELARGFNALNVGVVFIICFLIGLLIMFFVSVIKIYLRKREEFIRILYRNGVSNIKLRITYALVFMIIAVLSCTLAIIWGLIFNTFIIHWAKSILHIIIHSPNYIVLWLLGIAASLVVVCASLPLLLRNRLYKREVSNQ